MPSMHVKLPTTGHLDPRYARDPCPGASRSALKRTAQRDVFSDVALPLLLRRLSHLGWRSGESGRVPAPLVLFLLAWGRIMLAHLSDLHVLAPKRARGRSLELGTR